MKFVWPHPCPSRIQSVASWGVIREGQRSPYQWHFLPNHHICYWLQLILRPLYNCPHPWSEVGPTLRNSQPADRQEQRTDVFCHSASEKWRTKRLKVGVSKESTRIPLFTNCLWKSKTICFAQSYRGITQQGWILNSSFCEFFFPMGRSWHICSSLLRKASFLVCLYYSYWIFPYNSQKPRCFSFSGTTANHPDNSWDKFQKFLLLCSFSRLLQTSVFVLCISHRYMLNREL